MFETEVQRYANILDAPDLVRLQRSAEAAHSIEQQWVHKLEAFFEKLEAEIFAYLELYERLPNNLGFDSFLTEHYFEVATLGFKTAYGAEQFHDLPRLSAPPKGKQPKSLWALKEAYDEWKRGASKPKRPLTLGQRLQEEYFKKIRRVWKEHSEAWREGDPEAREEARRELQKQGRMAFPRAKMIVETETTHYYNQVRREVYDQSDDVTHYLFVAIRDHRTTAWCKTRNGIVMPKGTEILRTNTPPVHWNCRSEILPLSPKNIRHLALINDPTRRASNRRLEPLPPGWNNKVA